MLTTVDHRGLVFKAHDAGSVDGAKGGVVVLHAWWGLVGDVVDFADALAEAGYLVTAPDLVSGSTARTVEEAEALANGADEDHAEAVVAASIDRLSGELGEDATVAIVGFSFGAWWAVTAAADRPEVAASVVYYGAVWGDFVTASTAPVLGHFAEHDEFEPDENVAAFEQAFIDAGRQITVHRYPGTGHWFAEPSQDAYVETAADLAFRRTVEFLDTSMA